MEKGQNLSLNQIGHQTFFFLKIMFLISEYIEKKEEVVQFISKKLAEEDLSDAVGWYYLTASAYLRSLGMLLTSIGSDQIDEKIIALTEKYKGHRTESVVESVDFLKEVLAQTKERTALSQNSSPVRAEKDPLGGIDFNPASIEIITEGGAENVREFLDSGNWEKVEYDGLKPVMVEMQKIAVVSH